MKNLGLILGVASFFMWGAFPVYFKYLSNISPFEILANRILWSFIFVFFVLLFYKKLGSLKRYLLDKKLFFKLSICGILVSLNWGIYVYAITINRVLDASLGQFINPLMYMFLGIVFFKEKPSKLEFTAIFLGFLAIMIQVIELGSFPYIACFLSLSFTIYGLLKKKMNIPSLEGLFIETFVVAIISFFYISLTPSNLNFDLTGLLLLGCGIVTLVPMITFNYATLLLKLSTIGFLQYITPICTVIFGVVLFNEHFSIYKFISFGLIWIALIMITYDGYKRRKNV